jgi:uncharacterized glyoxalase superfamily protein PhnB
MEMGLQVYVKGSVAAVNLYRKAFGAALGYHVLNDDGTFMHAELEVDGKLILAVSESANDIGWRLLKEYSPSVRPTMNFGVTLADEAAVKHAYEVLSQEGVIVLPLGRLPWSDCCADVIDRFGVSWYLTVAGHRPEE